MKTAVELAKGSCHERVVKTFQGIQEGNETGEVPIGIASSGSSPEAVQVTGELERRQQRGQVVQEPAGRVKQVGRHSNS